MFEFIFELLPVLIALPIIFYMGYVLFLNDFGQLKKVSINDEYEGWIAIEINED